MMSSVNTRAGLGIVSALSLLLSAPALAQESSSSGAEEVAEPRASDDASDGASDREAAAPEPEHPAVVQPVASPAPVVVAPAAPPTAATSASSTPPLALSYELGRGFTVRAGDLFSANIQTRTQMRTTFAFNETADPRNETQIRTARLWFRGNVLEPNIRYTIQLALGAQDFESGNSSPVYDAYLEFTHVRDANVRVGQFFVPFDRARTIRESALQSVDRAQGISEFGLGRDIGVVVQSQDLFGLGGVLGYHLGIFGGDGRNRVGTHALGFLYSARVFVRPFGTFDDDSEGDLTRQPNVRLMIGGGLAYNQSTDRPQSTTGTAYSFGSFDYTHAAGDFVLKYAGLYLLGEVIWRQANQHSLTRTNPDTGEEETIYAREGWSTVGQASYNFGPVIGSAQLELWGRYEHVSAAGGTDNALVTMATNREHGLGGGANLYFAGHSFKVQLDWAHWFGGTFSSGDHLVRLQLDTSF